MKEGRRNCKTKGVENGGNGERETGTGPELYLKTKLGGRVGGSGHRRGRNSLSLLFVSELSWAWLGFGGGRCDLSIRSAMWISVRY